jgi:hypothetical protein
LIFDQFAGSLDAVACATATSCFMNFQVLFKFTIVRLCGEAYMAHPVTKTPLIRKNTHDRAIHVFLIQYPPMFIDWRSKKHYL